MLNNPNLEADLLNKCSCLAPALGVTKFIIVKDMIWVTLCGFLSRNQMFNKPPSGNGFYLSSTAKCDQSHDNYCYESGHT